MLIVNVLIFFEDELADWLLVQFDPFSAQQSSSGEVSLQDQPLLSDGKIAHRRHVVEVEIALPLDIQLHLGTVQLIVLHLQFDLMHPQFVDDLLRFFQRNCFRQP